MTVRRSLFTKYVTLIVALVCFVLVASSAVGLWFSSKENVAQLEALQHEKALAAATRIELYIKDIEHQMSWTTLPQIGAEGNGLDTRRFEYLKLLRQAPAISEIVWVDKAGREQVRVSRLALDVMGGGADMSAAPYFKPGSTGAYYGPVYFRKETEPYMTIARPAGGASGGVIAAEVNLKFVLEVVKEIDAGKNGVAYVVNSEGTLIAHPDISLVLQKTSLATLPQVAAVMRGGPSPDIARDPKGGKVLSAQAPIPTLGWHVFVEAPLEEAFAPLYASIYRTGYLLIAGLVLSILASLFLARRMVRPIRALQAGTAKLGAGELDQRIEVKTGDELEALAGQFNTMAEKLGESYADLEKKVEDRTHDLAETLAQQTATSEVLKVISGSMTDVKPVFEAIVHSCSHLVGGSDATLFLVEGDRLVVSGRARSDPNAPVNSGNWLPLDSTSVVGASVTRAEMIHLPDLDPAAERYPKLRQQALASGYKSMVAAPLLRDGRGIGVLSVLRRTPGEFSEKEQRLLKTFADQASIAIENVRLFNETQEALEQQTATAEVLRVISRSPTDVQPVLDAVAERAEILCEGGSAVVYLAEGDVMHRVAMHGPLVTHVRASQPLNAQSVSGRAMVERSVVEVRDLALQRERYPETWHVYESTLKPRGVSEHHSMIAVPMLKEGASIGAIMIRRAEVRPFTEKQIALLQVFADQAVIAIENVRLFNEIQESLERQTATANVLKVISRSNVDTMPVFEEIVRSAKELGDAVGAAVFSYDGEVVDYVTSIGLSEEWKERTREHLPRAPDQRSAGGRAILEARVVKIEDIEQDPDYEQAVARHSVGRRLIAVPMLLEGKPIGSINVTWRDPGPISDKHVRMLQTFADQAVIAVTNVRLFREIQEKSAQLEIANKHKSEFLANMSHELRTPLNAIIGFSEVLQDSMFGELNDEQLEFIKDIHESGKHLLSLINDILDLSKVEAGRMELMLGEFDLPSAVSNALALVKERANRHRIRLTSDVDPELGNVRADERKLKQILLNLLSNAVKFTPEGGAVKVSARRVDGGMEIAVSDTGVGIAPEDREAVFEEFRQVGRDYTRKAEGTGLGLALTRKFVQLHGGNIRLESELGRGSTFTVFIPEVVTVLEEAHGE